MDRPNRSEEPPPITRLLEARTIVARYHPRTPLFFSAPLSSRFGCEVYVKYENHSFIRSFKARGAIYKLWRLSQTEGCAGVVTASTGNHGQGVAYAGKTFGISTTIVVPHNAPQIKCKAIQALGGRLHFFGQNFDQAARHARELAAKDR